MVLDAGLIEPFKNQGIAVRHIEQNEQHRDEDHGKKQDLIDDLLLMVQVHEDQGNQGCFKRCHNHPDHDVHTMGRQFNIRQPNGDDREQEQQAAYDEVLFDRFLDFFEIVSHDVRSLVWGLEEIEKREEEDPDEVNKVPEEAADFDAIR